MTWNVLHFIRVQFLIIMHMAKTKGSFAANLMQNQRLKFGLFKAEDTIYIYIYVYYAPDTFC